MSAFSKIVAAVIYTPLSIASDAVKAIKADLHTLDEQKAIQKAAMSRMEVPELTKEELEMIAARRAKRGST